VRVSGADETAGSLDSPDAWLDLVSRRAVQPDTRHRFLVDDRRPVTHIRLDVYPDGGLARLRCNGEIDSGALADLGQRWWESLPQSHRDAIGAYPL
jgi:allantoicase